MPSLRPADSNTTPKLIVRKKRKDSRRSTPEAISRRNERERNRVKQVNLGFVTLRKHVPQRRRMSKVETLRAAVDYIDKLQQTLGMEARCDMLTMPLMKLAEYDDEDYDDDEMDAQYESNNSVSPVPFSSPVPSPKAAPEPIPITADSPSRNKSNFIFQPTDFAARLAFQTSPSKSKPASPVKAAQTTTPPPPPHTIAVKPEYQTNSPMYQSNSSPIKANSFAASPIDNVFMTPVSTPVSPQRHFAQWCPSCGNAPNQCFCQSNAFEAKFVFPANTTTCSYDTQYGPMNPAGCAVTYSCTPTTPSSLASSSDTSSLSEELFTERQIMEMLNCADDACFA